MKDKKAILNISLAILMILSLIANVILFNQFFKGKQTFTTIEKQLNNSKIQSQNAEKELQGTTNKYN